ncbi:rhodanese-like domain-containing protein [bacterium]|nr:rhodanese-like domain-containing protein [bacterium]
MRISAAEVRRLAARGALVLDVRTPQEYGDGHLPGAVNLPLSAITQARQVIGSTDRPVIVYCRSGARSARAAAVLTAGGWRQVDDLGGLSNWDGPLEP